MNDRNSTKGLRGLYPFGLSRREAAWAAGVSPGTFDKMVLEGAMPAARIWGSRKLWVAAEIERALIELPSEDAQSTLNAWDGAR